MYKHLKKAAAIVLAGCMVFSSAAIALAADIPLRDAFENRGATVLWDDGMITITHGEDEIVFTIGSDAGYLNGERFTLSAPITLADERTMMSQADFEALLAAHQPFGMAMAVAEATAAILMEAFDLPGMTIALVHHDTGFTWTQGFGYADVAAQRPVDEFTLFDVGSLTKAFAGVAVMQLVEQGLLDLDTPVVYYLPEFSVQAHPIYGGDYRNITARMLLSHTSGLPVDFFSGMMSVGEHDHAFMNDFLPRLANSFMDNSEATRIAYANNGTMLAGILAAHVAGYDNFFEGYMSLVHNNVLPAAGMPYATFAPAADANKAGSYIGASAPAEDAHIFTNNLPGGGLFASAADVAAFMHTILGGGGDMLTEASVAEMFRVQDEFDMSLSPSFRTGLGVYEFTWPDGLITHGHGGNSVHHHTEMQMHFETGIGVFVSVNGMMGAGAPGALAHAVLHTAITEAGGSIIALDPLPPGIPAELTQEELEAFTGYFTTVGRVSINENGILQINAIPGVPFPIELTPFTDGSFGTILDVRFWIEELNGVTVVFQGDHKLSLVAERIDNLWQADEAFAELTGRFVYNQAENAFPTINASVVGIDNDGYAYIEWHLSLGTITAIQMPIGRIDDNMLYILGTGRNLGMVILVDEDGQWLEVAGTRFERAE